MLWRSSRLISFSLLIALVTCTAFVQLLFHLATSRKRPPAADDDVIVDDDVDVITYAPRSVRPALGGDVFRVAIGGAISSKGIDRLTPDTISTLPMFWVLFQSFCRTASPGYLYHFYFGYDFDDALANDTYRAAAIDAFHSQMASSCGQLLDRPQLHLLQCPYTGKPAWAQNDAMMAAYVDGMDFFYRLNDDTLLVTRNWTAKFVEKLSQMAPPYVGAVGPFCDRGPRIKILTHDFVHRTHLEIFGYYYPRLFSDWYADNWITHVYGKDVRAFILDSIVVNHTETLGKRYQVEKVGHVMERFTNETARKDHQLIERYVKMFLPGDRSTCSGHTKRCSISINLFGGDTRLTHGAIRNAQLAPVLYPGWKLRIYYRPRPTTTSDPEEASFAHLYVPDNVIQTLENLGADLMPVTDEHVLRKPHMWRRLVFEDSINDEFILIWQADTILSDNGALSAS